MNRLFGKKKAAPAPTVSLDATCSKLNQKSTEMDAQIADLDKKIHELVVQMKNPKNRARVPQLKKKSLDLIRRKKQLESMQSKIDGQRFNLDNMAFQQTQIQTNIDTYNVMKQTNQVMKDNMKNMKVEDFDDLQMDMEDMMDQANEITDILSSPVGVDCDDADLEGELELLQADFEDGEIDLEGLEDDGPSKTPAAERW